MSQVAVVSPVPNWPDFARARARSIRWKQRPEADSRVAQASTATPARAKSFKSEEPAARVRAACKGAVPLRIRSITALRGDDHLQAHATDSRARSADRLAFLLSLAGPRAAPCTVPFQTLAELPLLGPLDSIAHFELYSHGADAQPFRSKVTTSPPAARLPFF